MAESFTSYSVDTDARFRNALSALSKELGDLRIPLGQISRDFYRSEQSIFKLKSPGQYPDYKHGKESKYAKQKERRRGFRYPLLVDSGRLAASMTGPNNPGAINFIGKTSLLIGTSVRYGYYHQSDKPRKVIPLRKFLFIGPEAKRFATSDQIGRLDRWLGYLYDYALNVAIKKGLAVRLPVGGP